MKITWKFTRQALFWNGGSNWMSSGECLSFYVEQSIYYPSFDLKKTFSIWALYDGPVLFVSINNRICLHGPDIMKIFYHLRIEWFSDENNFKLLVSPHHIIKLSWIRKHHIHVQASARAFESKNIARDWPHHSRWVIVPGWNFFRTMGVLVLSRINLIFSGIALLKYTLMIKYIDYRNNCVFSAKMCSIMFRMIDAWPT